MGNDVYLTASTDDPLSESPGMVTYIGCERTERVGLFWLCCFRPKDLRASDDYVFGAAYCCKLDTGIQQFREGMQILLGAFPLTEKENPSLMFLVGKFVEELERSEAQYLLLNSCECDDMLAFSKLLNHAIEGFLDHDITKHYQARDREYWESSYALPAESGVMSWAGALRRLVSTEYRIPPEDHDVESGDLLPGLIAADSLGRATNGRYVDEE